MAEKVEVAIIGGGCIGASIAFHLAKLGVTDVALFERRSPASGTTGKSTAIIRLHYSNETVVRMAQESLHVFQNFESVVGGDAGFRKTGWVFCVGPTDEKNLKENVSRLRSLGVNTRILSREELRKLEPRMFVDDVAIAAFEPDAGYADPSATTASFIAAAQKLGVHVYLNSEVVDVSVSGGRARSLCAGGREIKVGCVVNAANVWSNKLAAMVSLPLPVTAHRTIMCLFGHETLGPMPLIVVDQLNMSYLRPEVGSQTWVGEMETDLRVVEDPDRFKEGVDLHERLELGEKLVRRFPAFAEAEIRQSYAALYDVTPDWHPILDRAPHLENYYVAVGFSGHGFKLCPAVGRIMAELIDGRNPPEAHFFRLSRFDEQRPIGVRYGYSWMG